MYGNCCVCHVKLLIKLVSNHYSLDFLGKGRVFEFESIFRVSTLLFTWSLALQVKLIIVIRRKPLFGSAAISFVYDFSPLKVQNKTSETFRQGKLTECFEKTIQNARLKLCYSKLWNFKIPKRNKFIETANTERWISQEMAERYAEYNSKRSWN